MTEIADPDILPVGLANDANPREAAAIHSASASEVQGRSRKIAAMVKAGLFPPVVIPLVIRVAVLAGWYARVSG